MSKLTNEIEEYREPNGVFVSVHRNPDNHSCDNGLLFTSTYLVQLTKQKDLEPGEVEREFKKFAFIARDCEIEPGLYNRYPNIKGDFNSWDDLVGISSVSASLADKIYMYGKRNGWMFDTQYPERKSLLTKLASPNFPRSWLYRIPIFKPFLKVASLRPLTLLDELVVAGVYLANMREPTFETSGRCLLYLMMQHFKGKSWVIDWALKRWVKFIDKHFGGIAGVYAVYFGPEHPLTCNAID